MSALAAFAIVLAVIFHSCDYSYFDIEEIEYNYSPEFALPLVNANMYFEDLVEQDEWDMIEVDDENLIHFIFKDSISFSPGHDLFDIPDQEHGFSISIDPADFNFNEFKSSNDTVYEETIYENFVFEFPGEEVLLEYIEFLEGLMTSSVEAQRLEDDGFDFVGNFEIIHEGEDYIGGTLSLDSPSEVNFEGKTIEFLSETQDNSIGINIEYYIVKVDESATPGTEPYNINFEHSILDMMYKIVVGFIGEIEFEIGDGSIALDFFEMMDDADIILDGTRFDLIINNSLGVPVDILFDEFYASKSDESTMELMGEEDRIWSIRYPENIGDVEQTAIHLHDKIDVNEILSFSPEKIYYDMRTIINHQENKQNSDYGFIKYDSEVGLNFEIDVPLWGGFDIALQDTVDISFEELPDELEELTLNINIDNGFPLGAEIQAYFLTGDEHGEPIENLVSLFEDDDTNIIDAAPTDPDNNIVIEPKAKRTFVTVDRDKFDTIKNAEHLILRSKLNTYNFEEGETVKILNDYNIGFQMGVKAKLSVDL